MPSVFQPVTPAIIDQLTVIVGGEQISATQADLDQHAHDQGFYPAHAAEVVVWPTSTAQVSQVLALANKQHIPVTAWGAGTSIEANPIPIHGGIVLSLQRMDAVIAIHADDFQVTVQPGIGYKDLNARLARAGLFFAPDPGANASIGGMLANNAAGIRTVRFGATKDNVLRMQVVLADGRVTNVGSRSVKQSSGYDLLHLLVGSEGTLGIITEATLRLFPIAEHISAAVATFETITAAIEAVVAVRSSGLEPSALEFLDAGFAQMLNDSAQLGLLPKPTLFMEFQAAHVQTLTHGIETVREICQSLGALNFSATTSAIERKRLWQARNHAYEILVRTYPGKRMFTNDVAVPISSYPALIAFIQGQLARRDALAFLLGHAGDGNIHVIFPCADDAEYAAGQAINADIVRKALELGGTATGEHGVGLGKARFMPLEHGIGLDVMRSVKQALDPNGILNPGKIFPT
ncbi:MAG: FAD-binding oxidoreductase [Roseiflexaceae bacterium]